MTIEVLEMMNFTSAINILRGYAANELGVNSNGVPEIIEAVQQDDTDISEIPMDVRRAYRVVMGDLSKLLG